MKKVVKQISSLEKVGKESRIDCGEISEKTLLKGESFFYQIAINIDEIQSGIISVESPIKDYVNLFYVDNAVMDIPTTEKDADEDDNYITHSPGLMPDILVPATERKYIYTSGSGFDSLWVEVNLPENIAPGKYDITVKFESVEDVLYSRQEDANFEKTMTIEVIDDVFPHQKLIYTRWFYADCISDYHKVEIYSDKHFELIEKYIRAAGEVGVNMILVPVHTPPLDTAPGTQRPCVQLVDIEKVGDDYHFKFDKFKRFISICKNCNIEFFEIAHMFSQWGAKSAPNILVSENGKTYYKFGWHTPSDSDEYTEFLKQYIPAIIGALKDEGIDDKTYFHVSDEPSVESIDSYRRAYNVIKPLIGSSKTFDALSDFKFYKTGLVECPVTSVSHIEEFLEHKIENQWVYYCCGPQSTYTNSILAMPLSRIRILGFLAYKYDIKGFLHWGLNFYNSRLSLYNINPYTTTSSDGAFPSGDPFILYPSKDGVYQSLRGKATYEAIGDMRICCALEKYIGKEKVIEIIDETVSEGLTFSNYPKNSDYTEVLRDKMVNLIKKNITSK